VSTVYSRTFRSTPERSASDTWQAIVELLTKGKSSTARNELLAVAGIASSLIADQAPKGSPIVVTCDGPRTRIYCLYDDDAIEGDQANEDTLGFDPINGAWAISLPCPKDELGWVQPALKAHSSRITARDLDTGIATENTSAAAVQPLTLNIEAFLKP
jgi:hypothetical protein